MKTLNLMILVLFLTGCSAFEQQMNAHKKGNKSCCTPDTEFPHSCDGWILCDKPVIIEEIEL